MKNIQHDLLMLFSIGGFLCLFMFLGMATENAQAAKINQSVNARLSSGLIGLWSFDDQDIAGTNVYDRSTSFATGTLSGTTVPSRVTGRIGQALNFDGSTGFVNLGNATALKVNTLSVAAWIKIPVNNTATGYIYRFRSGIELYSLASGKVGWSVFNGSTSGVTSSTLATYNDNKWHHVVGEYNGSLVKLYMDGQQTDSKSFSGNISYGTGAAIGRDGDNNGTYFKGSIDDVHVYNRVLSAAEVKQLYNMGVSKVNASTNARAKSGLVGLWSFDNQDIAGTNAYDKSTSFATGTLSGTTVPVRASGRIGQSLNFDGSTSYITVADQSSLDQTSTLTLAGWVRPTAIASGSNINSIIEKGDVTSAGYGILATNGNRFCGFVTGTSGSYGGASTNSFNLNTWQHITIVVDKNASAVLKLYINGNLETLTTSGGCTLVTTFSGSITPGTAALTFGARSGSSSFFNGKIDDTRVFNRALSAAEVKQLYNMGVSKVNASTNARAKSGLVGLWSFDNQDIAGTNAYDKSTSFATGTLSGTTVPVRASGRIGQSLNFDGSTSYITVADQSSLDQTSTLTLAGWVRPRTIVSGSGNVNSIIEKGNVNTAGYGIFSANSNRFCGFVKISDGLYGGASTNSFKLNTWHHVAITVDASASSNKLKLYVDGIQETLADITGICALSTSPTGTSISNDTSALTFGARTGTSSFFDGKIDEARIFNRALSAAEVKQLYNLGK